MSDKGKKVQIFMVPQQFPCGPQSSCCGPLGQSKEEVESLKSALEGDINCPVEVIDLMGKKTSGSSFNRAPFGLDGCESFAHYHS